MRNRILASAIFLVLFGTANATTRTMATCSITDYDTQYALAVDGDTVAAPAGTCTWNAERTISKGISFIGVSASSPTITGLRLVITVPAGKAWRVGQMAVAGTSGINVTGYSKAGRIDHMNWPNITGNYDNRMIYVTPLAGGYSTGVIDHMVFTLPQSIQIHVREDGDHGNSSWMRPLDPGGPDAWYIEDSDFSQCDTNPCTTTDDTPPYTQYQVSVPTTDCDGGGRIVFRHNNIRSNYTEMHDAIVSGTRSCRKFELYADHWTTTQTEYNNTSAFALAGFRGGWYAVFDNVFDLNAFGSEMVLGNYRAESQTGGDPWANTCPLSGSGKACLNRANAGALDTCTTDANCGGVTGACVKIDGSGLGTGVTNYPCRDQMGTSGNAPQFIMPAIFWNNKRGSTQVPPALGGHFDAAYTVEGRDYCVGPTTSSSDDATQPTSCGGKTVRYSPYAYPHPLQSGAMAPLKPTGVH